MAGDVVLLEEHPDHLLLRLQRPEVHNAVDAAVMEGLERVLDELETAGETRPIVLTGAGRRTFCAGGDLRHFATLETREAARAMSLRMQAILRRLDEGPRPVLAAVNGDAFGGGCELLTACHLRVAAAHARFCFKQASLGVTTGWGGGMRLFRLLGRSAALRLLLTAEEIDAAEALRLGLVDRVVPGEEVVAEAARLARRIAANHGPAVRGFLELARRFEEGGDAEDHETETFADLWAGEAFRRRIEEWRSG